MEKIACNGMKWGQGFFPANADLTDILGDTDVNFENFYFSDFFGYHLSGIPNSWISRFLDFQIPGSWNQVPGYGWLRLGGAPVDGTPGPQNSGDPRN